MSNLRHGRAFKIYSADSAVGKAQHESFGKRAIDIVFSAVGLVLLIPVFLIAAIMIAATSRGGVFYVQSRVGKHGRRFQMIKFRSMFKDAENYRDQIVDFSDRDGTTFKMIRDPRITPVGRLLRRASIDELPQLINVLLGDMSLVGPRPALPVEIADYPFPALERLSVLPGITGLWQVSGRADLSFDRMVDLDLEYVRDITVLKDLNILVRTVGAVVSGRGAY
jgi:lipopolysaccharide/colanic/teichoic acid biosynthesis glycosyltransferase